MVKCPVCGWEIDIPSSTTKDEEKEEVILATTDYGRLIWKVFPDLQKTFPGVLTGNQDSINKYEGWLRTYYIHSEKEGRDRAVKKYLEAHPEEEV